MPFTLVAFQEAEPSAADVEENIAGAADQHVRVDDDIIYMADYSQIIAVYVGGCATIDLARLVSPSLRRLAPYHVSPLSLTNDPAGDDAFIMHPESPLGLEKNEGLEAIVTDSVGVVAEVTTVGVWLADGPILPITGEIFHVRAEADITEADLVWANGEITFDDTLPVGRYQIVGASCFINDGVLFRFVPIGEAYRPGGLVKATVGLKTHDLQRNGGLGVWCEFDQITPPSVEVLSNEGNAGTKAELYIDLIKVG